MFNVDVKKNENGHYDGEGSEDEMKNLASGKKDLVLPTVSINRELNTSQEIINEKADYLQPKV
jgi:hypothetical protein